MATSKTSILTPEELPKHEHKMPFSVLELLESRIEDELKGVESGIADLLPPDPTDVEIAEAELRDAALDRVAEALVKLGLAEADLQLAFGIEPAAVRKAKIPKKKAKSNGKKANVVTADGFALLDAPAIMKKFSKAEIADKAKALGIQFKANLPERKIADLIVAHFKQ